MLKRTFRYRHAGTRAGYIAVFLTVGATAVDAQTPRVDSPALIAEALAGAHGVRALTGAGCVVRGRLLSADAESITIAHRDASLPLAVTDIERLEASWQDSVWQGALWGTALGGARALDAPNLTTGAIWFYTAASALVGMAIDRSIVKHQVIYSRGGGGTLKGAPKCPRLVTKPETRTLTQRGPSRDRAAPAPRTDRPRGPSGQGGPR